jgi:hypothetical protein
MATEKLNEGQSVRVEQNQTTTEPSIDDINLLPEEVTRTRKHFFLGLSIIFLFLICIFLARVPYLGSYADAYLFELIFGNVKYVVYAFLITLLMFRIFHVRAIKLFRTKRFIFGFVLMIVGFILILAITQKYLLPNTHDVNLNTYINNFVK